jgi:hypothetical protein
MLWLEPRDGFRALLYEMDVGLGFLAREQDDTLI